MKLAKFTKLIEMPRNYIVEPSGYIRILRDTYVGIFSNSIEDLRDLYQRQEEFDKVMHYNKIVIKRNSTTMCFKCKTRKNKKEIKKIQYVDRWHSENICNECFVKKE